MYWKLIVPRWTCLILEKAGPGDGMARLRLWDGEKGPRVRVHSDLACSANSIYDAGRRWSMLGVKRSGCYPLTRIQGERTRNEGRQSALHGVLTQRAAVLQDGPIGRLALTGWPRAGPSCAHRVLQPSGQATAAHSAKCAYAANSACSAHIIR